MKFRKPIAKIKEQRIFKEEKVVRKPVKREETNTLIEKIKVGDFFMKKGSAKIYQRGNFSRELKKYSYSPVDDVNSEYFMKKGTKIFTKFEY